VPVPYSQCKSRSRDRVSWSTDVIDSVLDEATKNRLAIVKIHSHREAIQAFSEQDDTSDREIYEAVFSLLNDDLPHASAIMLPDGSITARAIERGQDTCQFSSIMVVGDDIVVWRNEDPQSSVEEFARRHAQIFGTGTTTLLRRLSVAVIGCSGTGSVVVEQLARLGVGRLVLVDPDVVEEKNLNRILNAGKEDAYLHRPKVQVLASAIARIGLGQEVDALQANLGSQAVVMAVAECDVVFGCMDGVTGRQLLNRLATFYTLPYFDVGVCLEGNGEGGVDAVAGAVHYLQPGLSALIDRGVYDSESVRAEGLHEENPELYQRHRREGYIRGVKEDRPAVITVNMLLASLAVNDFLARIHPYRNNSNADYATIGVNLKEVVLLPETESGVSGGLAGRIGWGDVRPLLERPALS